MSFRPLLPPADCRTRLRQIFPPDAFDTVLSNPLAAAGIAAMLYVDAVVPDAEDPGSTATWARPSTILWMSDEAYAHATAGERTAWRTAALRARKQVEVLLASWGETHLPWYGDNSRETLRDETFPNWLGHGAVRVRPGIPTNSSKPRWALTASFADLFDPDLTGEGLTAAVDAWSSAHLSPGARVRADTARQREQQAHAVTVTLPNGTIRILSPGTASLILKGVIEQWAPARLIDPVVLTVSEPGDKVYVADDQTLRRLGLTVDQNRLLPDAVLVDIGSTPVTFWVVEAVATDGVITEDRRQQLLDWATDQRIAADSCKFLTAFAGRNSPAARRRLKDLAVGTYAWYADEPTRELAWYELDPASPAAS